MFAKAIIFDFNGVLLWDSPLQEQAWNDAAVLIRGTPFTDQEIAEMVHGRTNRMIIDYLAGKPISDEAANQFIHQKEEAYRALCLKNPETFKLSPGAITLFDFLKAHNIPRTIASASPKENIDFFVEYLHLANWFDEKKIVYDDGKIRGKPYPDMYLRAAENLSQFPKDCVVVEDALSGIAAARAAGIQKIFGLGPLEKHRILKEKAGANETILSLEEFPTEIFSA